MADQSDVETALVELAAAALYPSGSTGPSAVGPVCRIYRGWPVPAALDADLAAGQINVTVYAVDAPAKTTTRYPSVWTPTAQSVPTLIASVSGVTAAFTGTAAAGQIAGIAVDGLTYVYRTTTSDTPDSVAANLATLVNADRIALLAGSTVTVPGAGTLLARVVADVPAVQEVRRQERNFRISCWCPSPATRDATASCIDLAMAAIHFVSMPDGSSARLQFEGGALIDHAENASLYRRDLIYRVEYPTILTATLPSMLFGSGTLDAASFIG